MKSILSDFYSAEELSVAKFQLYHDINKLDSTLKRPHIGQRRDTDVQSRINKEVDDIFLLITFADENKLIDKLPRYVASSPEKMPSMHLYEGDINTLLNLWLAMEKRLIGLESGLSAICHDVHSLKVWPSLPVRAQPTQFSSHSWRVAGDTNSVTGS